MDSSRYVLYVSYFLAIVVSLPFHEFAHACVANFLGDDTARKIGRMSMNPVRHLDLVGFFCLLFLGFGWARPVPVSLQKFSKPKRDMALVSMAGPLSNLLLALMSVFIYKLMVLLVAFVGGLNLSALLLSNLSLFFSYFAVVNINLAIFNLIPIPPLDGSRVLMSFLPDQHYYAVLFLEKFGRLFILILIMNHRFNELILFFSGKVLSFLNFLTSNLFLNLI